MNIGNVIKRDSNLSNLNNKKGMLTATIEQECSASIKHRALLVLHTHTTILNHCLITLSNDLTERLYQENHSCKTNSVSATVTNNTKITTVYTANI